MEHDSENRSFSSKNSSDVISSTYKLARSGDVRFISFAFGVLCFVLLYFFPDINNILSYNSCSINYRSILSCSGLMLIGFTFLLLLFDAIAPQSLRDFFSSIWIYTKSHISPTQGNLVSAGKNRKLFFPFRKKSIMSSIAFNCDVTQKTTDGYWRAGVFLYYFNEETKRMDEYIFHIHQDSITDRDGKITRWRIVKRNPGVVEYPDTTGEVEENQATHNYTSRFLLIRTDEVFRLFVNAQEADVLHIPYKILNKIDYACIACWTDSLPENKRELHLSLKNIHITY